MNPTGSPQERILVVAPTPEQWTTVNSELSQLGYQITTCNTALEACNFLDQHRIKLVLFNDAIRTGVEAEFYELMRFRADENSVIALPMFCGARSAPATRSEASHTTHSRLSDASVSPHLPQSKRRSSLDCPQLNDVTLIGRSAAMKDLLRMIDRIANIDRNVLITGATGTGKELVAREIHSRSGRRKKALVDVNCSAVPETLFEAEFFGHERGTFTGAHETRAGLFELANGGTLFLDEVDTLTLPMQAKLLRVLQERQVRRVGGRENIPVDARIIAATNADLKAAVSRGAYRSDLYFRLRVVPLHLPTLNERRSDIPILVEHFVSRLAVAGGQKHRFSPEAIEVLTSYSWPGNVRELENVIEYAIAIATGSVLGIEELPADVFEDDTGSVKNGKPTTVKSLAQVERQHILSTFESCGRHHVRTAALLGIDRRTLYRKLQQYDIEVSLRENVVGF
jgi:DNA-binding NtrC family response regulator